MSRTLYARLVAYRAFGERLGVLPEPVSFDASIIHNDSGALSVEYSALSAGASLLDGQLTDGLEIALEVSDGTGYTEPDNARFVITGRSGKTDDRTGTVKYTGQCIQWLLSKAKMLDTEHLLTDGDNKGKRPFYSANPGTIVKTLMDENAARGGVAAGLTLGFDTAKDAGGDDWARTYTLYYSLGVDLQSALSSLVHGGGCDWRTSKRQLNVYNADSGKLSRDLSKSVILHLGRDISEAPYEESISSLASTILVEGDNSLVFTMDNPAAPHPWGKWEDYVSQGGVSDEATATAFMQAQLADAARVRGQYTRSVITAGNVTSLPLIDYRAGDWITAPTVSHAEKTRVQEIDVSMRQGDGLAVSLALNDVKYDASVRQAKRMQGITGGASLAGSQGGKAAGEHDHRVAAAPTGLVAATTAYMDSTGHARGLATVQWAAVTTATDGTALETSGYAVEWRKHTDGAPWHAAGSTDKTTLGIGSLDCGTQVEIRVRANATYSDQPGAWATPVVVTVENDVTPCSVPSKPVLSSALGVVTIHWDGKTDAGANMELDFDHVEVGRGTAANDLTPIAATQSGQGDYLDTTRDPGSTWSYALRSVDHTGNRSAWSALATVTVASTVSAEEVQAIQSDLSKAQSDIAAAESSMTDLTKTVSTVDGKATTSGSAPTTSDASGKPEGAMWYVMDSKGNIAGTYILKSGSWVKYAWASSSIADDVNQSISNAFGAAQNAIDTAGKAATSIITQYAVSDSDSDPPDSGWSTDRPKPLATQFAWTRLVTTYGDGNVVTSSPALATGTSAILLNIHSDRGLAFHNNAIDTTLKLTIICGSRQITNLTGLHEAFGTGAYVQWLALTGAEQTPVVISSSDPMLSDDGFTLTVSPDNVDMTVTFTAQVIV